MSNAKFCLYFILLLIVELDVTAQVDYLNLYKSKTDHTARKLKVVEIIDAREDTVKLGNIMKALGRRYSLLADSSLRVDLLEYFDNLTTYQVNPLPILMKVNYLWIDEFAKNEDSQSLDLSLEFFIIRNEQYYPTLDTAFYIGDSFPFRPSHRHATLLTHAIFECLQKIQSRLDRIDYRDEGLSRKDIIIKDDPLDLFSMPQHKKGAFLNFYDFIDHRIYKNTTIELDSDQEKKGNQIALHFYDKKIKKRNIWGFILDGQNYVQYDKKFYPLRFEEGQLLFEAPIKDYKAQYNVAVKNGLLGLLIHELISSDEMITYTISMKTGAIKPLFIKKGKAKVIFFPDYKNKFTSDIAVSINKEIHLSVPPNDSISYMMESPNYIYDFCATYSGQSSCTQLTNTEPNLFYFEVKSNKGKFEIKRVNSNYAGFHILKLQKNKRRGKR